MISNGADSMHTPWDNVNSELLPSELEVGFQPRITARRALRAFISNVHQRALPEPPAPPSTVPPPSEFEAGFPIRNQDFVVDEPSPRTGRRDPQLSLIGRRTWRAVAAKLFAGGEIVDKPQQEVHFRNCHNPRTDLPVMAGQHPTYERWAVTARPLVIVIVPIRQWVVHPPSGTPH